MMMEGGTSIPPMRKTKGRRVATSGRSTSDRSTETSTKSTGSEAIATDRRSTTRTNQDIITTKKRPTSLNIN
jgi:hypothetical protein